MIQNGEILGGMYQIVCEIGQGGTGIIYLAEHLRLQKKVVVKKIKDHFVGQVNGRAEVDILKKLHHTCLPQVYDFLMVDSSVYTVMEYVEGYDLQWYLDNGYQFSEQMIQKWLLQLSEVLEYLHTQKPPILHSDIKPANLMVTSQWNICLIDFNISLDGENSKEIQGISPWFAAPEQYEKAQNVLYGKKDSIVLDGRMDVYSLGATFYCVMTRTLPSPQEGCTQDIMKYEIPYSEGLKAIISKAMQRKLSSRFQSAKQMHRALEAVEKMDPLYRRYGKLQVTGLVTWLLCVLVGVLFLYYGNWQNGVENWQKAYRGLYVSAENQEETEIVAKATEILNDYKYKGYMKKHEEAKAEVLHTLGESYFRQKKFQDAASSYAEAWKLQPDNGKYCSNYVIALVRNGQLTKAEQTIRSAEEVQNLSKSEQMLIQAEIAWMKKEKETALEQLKKLQETFPADVDVCVSAALLQSEIYQEEEQYEMAVEALEYAQKIKPSKEIIRSLGQASAEVADRSDREVVRKKYLKKALSCYQSLNQSKEPSYYDRLNYALVLRAIENYQKSNDMLRSMLKDYPEDYRISMWMCYNYIDLGALGETQGKWGADLKFRYNDCKRSYDISGETESDMEELIRIMHEVEE